MFLSERSPKGGMKLNSLMVWPDKPENLSLDQEEEMKHNIIKDYHCLCIGYVSDDLKLGDRVWIKPSEAYQLYLKLRREFGHEKNEEKTLKQLRRKEK